MTKKTSGFLQIRATDQVKADLDALRKMQRDLPTRTEMIKRLIRYGLESKLVVSDENVTTC